MKISSKDFRVEEGTKVKLNAWPTIVKPMYKSKAHYQKLLQEHVEQLSALHQLHYAFNRYAVLLIFQAMDAAGKDGTIKHVMSGVNPQGCAVASFKQPNDIELKHDFLWRIYQQVPRKGMIKIFNRSHYEEVLVTRVHPEYILNQNIPGIKSVDDIGKDFWKSRYDHINEGIRRCYFSNIKRVCAMVCNTG